MIIGCIGLEEPLRERLRKLPGVTTVYHASAEHIQDHFSQIQMCEVVLISDTAISLFELDEWVKRFEGCKLGYLVSYTADVAALEDAALLCKRLGMVYIPPKRTVEQLATAIGQAFLDQPAIDKGGKVIAFVGTLGQAGLTSTVLSLAEQIKASTKDMKIGVLGFNCDNPGDQLIKYHASYLNELVQIQAITTEELQGYMQSYGTGFYYLAGNSDLTKKYRYPTEQIADWIHTARQAFDLVLIDAGSAVDNNLCLQAILHANLRVVLTTNQPSALTQWQRQHELLRALAPELSFMLLVNKTSSSEAKQLQQALKLPLIGWLPRVPDSVMHEQERELLIASDHSKYREQMQALATLIQDRFQLTPKVSKKAWWKRWRQV